MSNITFGMIKPDAVAKNVIGEIIAMITKAGFKLNGIKMTRLSRVQAQAFYAVHKERSFYNELVEYMISGPIVALALEKDNAVEDFRKLIGATNPEHAEEGTIRKMYGSGIEANAIHGSDSNENAIIETGFFFTGGEIASVK